MDDDHIITTLKWAQNRISTLNDLVKKDLAFLWIIPSSVPNVKQTGCSCTNIFLHKRYRILFPKLYYMLLHFSDAKIKLLNAELVEIDASNYKTVWMTQYLKNFAKKNEIPFAALMKTLRSVMSGIQVNIT